MSKPISSSLAGWAGLALSLATLGAVGCATTRYGYRPATVVSSSEGGMPASHYGVPADAPRGEAFVTSFGTRPLERQEHGDTQLVHVRLAVANQSDPNAWSIDPSKLLLTPAGGAPQRPDFMEVDGRQNGGTDVARGQRRVLDLYYKEPAGHDVGAPPSFDFGWTVGLGDQTFAEHTPFVREPYEDYERAHRQYWAVGVAPPWWWAGYGPGWWGPWGWPYGYGPYVGFGVGYRGYYGPRYYGGHVGPGHFGGGRGAAGRVGPTIRGRAR